ncbi:TonB-dependent receptor [Sphingobium scionense]|uniref:TonB-dependent receptor n=1 Tax=Sphingobium scionense TaxID=1404341 RepID=A0A7W6LUP4_9SPHN|nr:TonB-dependent receptor [Sphingobium scionense]MBB4150784.1 TonB-dependent receptor [Sphingobium scionense]
MAQAQDAAVQNAEADIIVTGVRASLDRAIDIKRNSSGVVDAISAEDIGKFPDTNLAESLQRITGVSIDRVNGEGSQVTVRGFGGGFNLVTLNGRALPSANVTTVGGDSNADYSSGTSRSFDFGNLASEGVSTLEVYKTGRAAIPSGGIGASINVITRKPLDAREAGFSGTIGVKALYDTSVEKSLSDPAKITPEASGLLSWRDENEVFGVSIFGSYQKRNFSSRGATVNGWNIRRYSQFADPANGFVNANTQIKNAPTDPNTLVSVPNDSSYFYSQGSRERINGSAVVQFRPTETLTFTADALFAQNKQSEQRASQGNWFNRPFAQVEFDGNPVIATTTFLQENIAGVKDAAFEQAYRGVRNRLQDYGLNAKWEINDRVTLSIDGHTGLAQSSPNNPNGVSSTLVGLGAPVVASQSADFSGVIPVQSIVINDAVPGRGPNGNGQLDLGDLGSQMGRTVSSSQRQRLNEIRADLGWELDDLGSRFDVGGNYRTSKMRQARTQTQQTLGDWGIGNVGDIESQAPGVLQTYCLVCKFDNFDAKGQGATLVAFQGNAVDLYNALSPYYTARGNAVGITNREDNRVKEDIWSAYGQLTWKGELAGRNATLVVGARYERTKVKSTSLIAIPNGITWTADNDFVVSVSDQVEPISDSGSYNNFLPAMDFQIELAKNFIGRFSFSKTIARPDYGNLFVATSVGTPPRPIALGGVASGSTGNARLAPLISDNLDLSFEWYYKPSSYISAGVFEKRVQNFVGTGQTTRNLFGLRDVSSGAAGSRSGTALAELQRLRYDPTDVNLFTMTALLQEAGGNIQAASQQFQANVVNGALDQDFADQVLRRVDLVADANDPLYDFEVTQPINNRQGKIWGFELAAQHFFGNTGFGVSAAYTLVRGDVGIDVGADPSEDQFALVGLSDTANATLIYDKNGLSARLAYNWRDKFLQSSNRGGGDRNPVFVRPFGQLDLNISWDVSEQFAVSFEAINLTESDIRTYGRDKSNLWYAQELDRRFLLGGRFRF